MEAILKILAAILEILKELREYIFLFLGFALGIIGSFISMNPRLHNRILRIARLRILFCERVIEGVAFRRITIFYELTNGYIEPLNCHGMFVEFKDRAIIGKAPIPGSLFETLEEHPGKWYVKIGDFVIHNREKSRVDMINRELLEQLRVEQKITLRVCLETSRYGLISSLWYSITHGTK